MLGEERIGDWTRGQLTQYVLQQLRQEPSSLPRSLRLEEVGVAKRLDIEDKLDLSDQAAQSVLEKLAPLAVSNLAPGTDGDVLQTSGSDVVWGSLPGGAYIPVSTVDAKGDLLVGSAADAISRLGVGSDGDVLTADSAQSLGVKWAAPSGGGSYVSGELGYTAYAGTVTVNATSSASPNNVVSAGSLSFDGSAHYLEFYCPAAFTNATAGSAIIFDYWLDGARVSEFARVLKSDIGQLMTPVHGVIRVTPAAGSHTYEVKTYRTIGDGQVFGTGFIRIVKA